MLADSGGFISCLSCADARSCREFECNGCIMSRIRHFTASLPTPLAHTFSLTPLL